MSLFTFGLIRIGRTAEEEVEEANAAAAITSPPPPDRPDEAFTAVVSAADCLSCIPFHLVVSTVEVAQYWFINRHFP